MGKIIEYTSVTVGGRNIWELGEKVNEQIKAGFQPYGYPCIAGANNGADADGGNEADFVVVQAMVKYEDSKGIGAMVG